MNILEAIFTYETTTNGIGRSLTPFKNTIKHIDIDYNIPRNVIAYMYNVNYERYRQDQVWIELDVPEMQMFRITCEYRVILKLMQDHKAKIYLHPKRKYFELSLKDRREQLWDEKKEKIQLTMNKCLKLS